MKKLMLATMFALSLVATGCATLTLRPMTSAKSKIAERAHIGMSLVEFKKLAGNRVALDSRTADATVYRMNAYLDGGPDMTWISRIMLFHFDAEGRLVEIETRDLPAPPHSTGHFEVEL